MPITYLPKEKGYDIKPAAIPTPGNNSFLGDVFSNKGPEGKEINCGFYKQEDGEPLVYTYDYDEMKIILEVEGEFTFTDETGYSVSVKPGDVFFIKSGTTVTFKATGGYGLAFYTALRPAIA